MAARVVLERRTELDDATLADVQAFLDAYTDATGLAPLGEAKTAHLRAGAEGWLGILARTASGRVVGYLHGRWGPEGTSPRLVAETVVHPDGRDPDLPRRLLDEARAALQDAGGGALWVWTHQVGDPTTTAPARAGFVIQRQLALMARPLTEPPPEASPPRGVVLRSFRDGDTRALLEVNNAAFAGHPEQGGWDEATFAQRRRLDWFDPEGLILAWREGQAVGFHWTKQHPPGAAAGIGEDPAGEVYVIAAHPRAAGQGLGKVLLRAGLAHLHERGCRTAILYVDLDNRPAVGLYESDGFAVVSRDICYEDEVPAAADAHG